MRTVVSIRTVIAILGLGVLSGCVVNHSSYFADPADADAFAAGCFSGGKAAQASAQRRALMYRQTYSAAEGQLTRLLGAGLRNWAVILDDDRTIIDDGAMSPRAVRSKHGFRRDFYWVSWNGGLRDTALPGAAEFIRKVQAQGGKVIVVSDQKEADCAKRKSSLETLGIRPDGILCGGSADKQKRFAAIQAGTALPNIGPLDIVMYIGKSSSDFPVEAVRNWKGANELGTRLFLVPGSVCYSELIH